MIASLVERAPRHRILAACLTLAILIGGCDDPTAPLPREGPPDALHFSYGGFGYGVTIEAQGTTVVVWRDTWDWPPGVPVDTLRVVPAADAWRQFWAAADQAGVHHWKTRYSKEDIIDGTGWTLRLSAGAFTLESSGSNAYPDWFGREHGGVTPEFEAFTSALGDLIGEPL